jgi:hypothetical protein
MNNKFVFIAINPPYRNKSVIIIELKSINETIAVISRDYDYIVRVPIAVKQAVINKLDLLSERYETSTLYKRMGWT